MIDLHTHILPGVDDGPRDLAHALALIELARESGTLTLVATPHLRADHPRVVPSELGWRVAQVCDALARHRVGVRVLGGAEVDLDRARELSDADLRLSTLAANGRDLLVETPYGRLPGDFEDRLVELAGRGFRLTLAHPERNPSFQRDPHRLGLIAATGVLSQITASSLAAPRRAHQRRLGLIMLRRGWAHAIASDAHGVTGRPPDLRAGLGAAASQMGAPASQLRWLVTDAPSAILAGEDLPARPDGEQA